MPLTVACVLSTINGSSIYNRTHVERLEKQVSENIRQPYNFVCVDDSPLPGWWAKIDLFNPKRFKGRVMYLDLDVTVTGILDDVADYGGDFAICRDWLKYGFNSSVMSWNAGTADDLYTRFSSRIMRQMHGDQDWITMMKPEASKFPRDWCYSYKLGKHLGFPKDMRICVFHGRPKPWSVND
jgi:hypothetical protein